MLGQNAVFGILLRGRGEAVSAGSLEAALEGIQLYLEFPSLPV